MSFGFIGSVMLAIVGVAFLYVAVSHTQTANIIKAGGDAFSNGLKAATSGQSG